MPKCKNFNKRGEKMEKNINTTLFIIVTAFALISFVKVLSKFQHWGDVSFFEMIIWIIALIGVFIQTKK